MMKRNIVFVLIFIIFCLLAIIIPENNAIVPPKNPPEEMLSDYTFNGTIPIKFMYVDDTLGGKKTHFIYTKRQIDQIISFSKKKMMRFAPLPYSSAENIKIEGTPLDAFIQRIPRKEWVLYGLYLLSPMIKDKRTCLFGSAEPWVEAILLAIGASHVTVFEYNELTYDHPQISTIVVEQMNVNESIPRFDLCLSISSFDHDGLGRYGDPLNPWADIDTMSRIRTDYLVPGTGRLVLTVPVGKDLLAFNLLRRYGRLRLPKLLDGYEIENRIGWIEEFLDEDQEDFRQSYEPIFVLKPLLANDKSNMTPGDSAVVVIPDDTDIPLVTQRQEL